ncbi:MAG: hypothetical protein KA401_03575, partial [Anaerolineae bacterium]|nr:hypothetical protein [Anaerolineae bacterium]
PLSARILKYRSRSAICTFGNHPGLLAPIQFHRALAASYAVLVAYEISATSRQSPTLTTSMPFFGQCRYIEFDGTGHDVSADVLELTIKRRWKGLH